MPMAATSPRHFARSIPWIDLFGEVQCAVRTMEISFANVRVLKTHLHESLALQVDTEQVLTGTVFVGEIGHFQM